MTSLDPEMADIALDRVTPKFKWLVITGGTARIEALLNAIEKKCIILELHCGSDSYNEGCSQLNVILKVQERD